MPAGGEAGVEVAWHGGHAAGHGVALARGHLVPAGVAAPVADEEGGGLVDLAALHQATGGVRHVGDLHQRRVARRQLAQHAEGHRLVQAQRTHPLGVAQGDLQRECGAVGVADQVHATLVELRLGCFHERDDGLRIGLQRIHRRARKGRALAVAVQVGQQHLPVAREGVGETLPLRVRAGRRVQAHHQVAGTLGAGRQAGGGGQGIGGVKAHGVSIRFFGGGSAGGGAVSGSMRMERRGIGRMSHPRPA